MNTYLGQKGYTIPKKDLTPEQKKKLVNDLTIKPFTMGAPQCENKTFPVYRESPNKFYVPHYYGVDTFGPPKEYKISEGLDINLTFHGKPRDYQEPVINKFLQHCAKVQCGGGLLELYTAWGKTSASLYIAAQLKKKTIVIVHKEFLMNQWIERIQNFLPDARIGKIQGPTIDVENKDIVLCMLQSLVLKEYEPEIFDQFGLTIIDEVHHISSQTFSTSLFKLVTKYMLGLSATMERKDGTTNVFKMFLGDVIHKAERKTDNLVEVRAVSYKTDDGDFRENIVDWKGNTQISSMLNKLCGYNRRTEFILKILTDYIQVDDVDHSVIYEHKKQMDADVPICDICKKNECYLVRNSCCGCVKYCMICMDSLTLRYDIKSKEPKLKIKCPNCKKNLKYEQNYVENPYVKPISLVHTIIMSQNLSILHYIYNKIVCRNLASVGYYVGGMKEAELKQSEGKQIILASYAMASEGLDIPSLTTEFLITPKTDVVQIVGRILRAKHSITTPTIYDFVDVHDTFQRQWAKRKSYYKKQNYKIITTDNLKYSKKEDTWKVVYEPSMTPHKKQEDIDDTDDDDNDADKKTGGKDNNEVCFLRIK